MTRSLETTRRRVDPRFSSSVRYRSRTSMNVSPISSRPRSRITTTEPRASSSPSAAAPEAQRSRRTPPVRLEHHDGVRRKARGFALADRPSVEFELASRRRLDCCPTNSMIASPTPTSTAYCSGMMIVSTNVIAITAVCTVPVRITERMRAGLIVWSPRSR